MGKEIQTIKGSSNPEEIAIMNTPKDMRESTWPKGLYRRGDSYRFTRTIDRQRFFEVFGPVSHDEAERRVNRYNFDISDGKEPNTGKVQQKSSFANLAFDTWLPTKCGLEASSYSRYRAVLDNLQYYLVNVCRMPNPLLKDITPSIANAYIDHRRTTPLMPNGSRKFTRAFKEGAAKATLHFEKETLKQVFGFAIRSKLIADNPFAAVEAKKLTKKELETKHRPLTVREQAALEEAAVRVDADCGDGNAKFSNVVEFLCKTGERLNEMVHLEWSDINWEDDVINVANKDMTEVRTVPIPSHAVHQIKELVTNRGPAERLFATEESLARFDVCLGIREKQALLNIKVGEVDLKRSVIATSRTFKWHPKGSDGQIPMCDDVRHLLERLQESRKSNFVFAHHDGGRCRLDILDLLKKAQELAGIKGRLRVHDLRHTCGRRLREHGEPLETIMGILRHANIEETLIYAPYRREEGEKVINCLDVPTIGGRIHRGKEKGKFGGETGANVGHCAGS